MSIAESKQMRLDFIAGDRLRKAREVAGFTKEDFATKIGVHRDSITRAEASVKPKFTMIAAYALATGADAEWLKSGVHPPGLEPGTH